MIVYHWLIMAALTACKTCGGKISTEARVCPHCGQPDPDESSLAGKVRSILKKTNVIEAVKFVREQTGWGLKEAKDFVDSLR